MEVGKDMNENEFIAEAKIRGIADENIRDAIVAYGKLKIEIPNLKYEEMLERITDFQEHEKNEPEDTLSV
jgi:hypothetical protein